MKILNLDPLRLVLTQSGTRLLFNTCDLITILNFKISGGGGGGGEGVCGWGRGNSKAPPPLYETLLTWVSLIWIRI